MDYSALLGIEMKKQSLNLMCQSEIASSTYTSWHD